MSTIIAPNIEATCVAATTYNPNTQQAEDDHQSRQKETVDNLDLIVTFLNLPQTKTINECQSFSEKDLSTNHLIENSMEIAPVEISCYNSNTDPPIVKVISPITTATNDAVSTEPTTLTTLTNCNFYAQVQAVQNINAKDDDIDDVVTAAADDNDAPDDAAPDDVAAADDDYDSEEEELTNLTWLTELRNQSITWPGSINPTILDDNMDGNVGGATGENHNTRNLEAMDINMAGEKVPSLSSKMHNGVKIGLTNITNKTQINNIDTQGRHLQSAQASGGGRSGNIQAQVKRPTPAERFQIFIDKVKRDLLEYEQSAINYQTDTTEKPPFNYSHIIGMAMLEKGRVTLQQICSWIESKFAFFRVRKKWNNSIRHNLSLHHCFRKINRNKYEKGKGGYWELGVDPKKCDRKRIRNRKSANQKKKLNNQQNTNSSYDETAMATRSITAGIDIDVAADGGLAEELMLDDMDVQQNIDISSCQQQQQQQQEELHQQHTQNDLEQQLQQEEAFIANVLANCIEIESADVNHEMPINTTTTTGTRATCEPQYQLGTVIISTTAEDVATMNATLGTPLSSFIYTNNNGGIDEYCQGQKILYREDEIPQACENVIVSSFLSDNVDPHGTTQNPHRPNVIVEPLDQYYSVISASATTLVSANGDCTTIAGEHFRPYIDGIDEAFQYLRSMDNNRSEDLLDNLLDISVSDY